MSRLRGDLSSLKGLARKLRELPLTISNRIAAAAAAPLSAEASKTFAASQDAFGVAWAPSKDGLTVTLRKTGALAAFLVYVAIGSKIRVSLGVPYAKFQIGKRPVFPRQGQVLPPAYVRTLTDVTGREIRASLEVSS